MIKIHQDQREKAFITKDNNKKRAFSFLEVMIVVAILAGLAAIIGPAIFGRLDSAKVEQTRIQIKALENSLELYYLDVGSYPDGSQGLNALIQQPSLGTVSGSWNGPYLKNSKLPKDAWNNDFVYSIEGNSFTITSLGNDGQSGGDGTAKDISSKE